MPTDIKDFSVNARIVQLQDVAERVLRLRALKEAMGSDGCVGDIMYALGQLQMCDADVDALARATLDRCLASLNQDLAALGVTCEVTG